MSANALRLRLSSLAVYRVERVQVSVKSKEKAALVGCSYCGAQKATAVEHINQNSFLLIIFARTVIASSYDISSYNKIDVFSL